MLLAICIWISAFSVWIYDNEYNHNLKYYALYLSFWTQTLCLITALFRFLSTVSIKYVGDSAKCIERIFVIQSILGRTSLPMVTLVMVNYWTFMKWTHDQWPWTKTYPLNDYQVHGINCIVMWMDHLLSAELIFVRSSIWSFVLTLIYLGWNLIFEFVAIDTYIDHGDDVNTDANGHSFIYESTDWSNGWVVPFKVYIASVVSLALYTTFAAWIKNLILNLRMSRNRINSELLEQS